MQRYKRFHHPKLIAQRCAPLKILRTAINLVEIHSRSEITYSRLDQDAEAQAKWEANYLAVYGKLCSSDLQSIFEGPTSLKINYDLVLFGRTRAYYP